MKQPDNTNNMPDNKPKFDPSKSFDTVEPKGKPAFNPDAKFEDADLKKKDPTPSPLASGQLAQAGSAPSVSEGGTSGLDLGSSALPAEVPDYLHATQGPGPVIQPVSQKPAAPSLPSSNVSVTVKPGSTFDPFANGPSEVSQKTALGNVLPKSNALPSVSTAAGGGGFAADSKIAANEAKRQSDQNTKNLIDSYDTYKQTNAQLRQLAGNPTPDTKDDTIDFFWHNLQATDPKEYEFLKGKEQSLINDKVGHAGNKEDEKEDDLMIQKYQADIMQKALALKTKIYGGKYQMASNVIENDYKPVLDSYKDNERQISQQQNKLQDISSELDQMPKDENGQIVITPLNRKRVETLMKSREDATNTINSLKDQSDKITSDKDFQDAVALADDTQKNYQDLAKKFMDLQNKSPKFYDKLPELQKQVKEEQKAQAVKDITEKITGGDFGIGEGIGRGVTRIGEMLSFLPKAVADITPLGDGYGWTDKLHDEVKSNIDDFDALHNPLPTGYNKPVYDDETGEWNLRYLPGKVAGTVVEMAPIIAITALTEGATASVLSRVAALRDAELAADAIGTAGDIEMSAAAAGVSENEAKNLALESFKASKEDIASEMAGMLAKHAQAKELSTYAGAFMGEYATVSSDYYNRAKETGLSEKDAVDFSQKAATMQAILGAAFPDVKLMRAGQITPGLETYVNALERGATKKEAISEGLKTFSGNLVKEVTQENLQTLAETKDFNDLYQRMGLNDKVKNSVKSDVIETSIISFCLTAGFGVTGFKSTSRINKEALFMAASEPNKILDQAKKMLDNGKITDAQYERLGTTVSKAQAALNKMDPHVSSEKKIDMLGPMIEKNDLLEQRKKTDDTQHASIDEHIKNKDEEIKRIADEKSTEQQEHESFVSGFDKMLADKEGFEVPKSENEQQLQGLIDLDSKDKSEPIELSPHVESAPEKTTEEHQIDDLEAERKELKERYYWPEKIDYNEYAKRDAAIETKIEEIKKSISSEKQNQDSEITEDKKSSDETASGAEPPLPQDQEEQPAATQTEKKGPDNSSLFDEEEETEDKKKDDPETLKKMSDDLEVLKKYNPTDMSNKSDDELKMLAQKKYMAMIERAYKAKIDGKINRTTYTIFRNAAGDILGPKIAEKNREVKGQIDAIKEKIKEKLLGQGYKTMALSSTSPVNPQTVADFIDLTADLVKRGVDAGHEIRKVVSKALEYVRGHKNYRQALELEKVSDKDFARLFESRMSDLKDITKQEEKEPVKDAKPKETNVDSGYQKEVEESDVKEPSNNEEPENTAKNEKAEPKKEAQSNENSSDIDTEGNKKERKSGLRLRASEDFKNIEKYLDTKRLLYDPQKGRSEIRKYIENTIKEYEKNEELVDLANAMVDGDTPFDSRVADVAAFFVYDRLNKLAEKESDDIVKEELRKLAAKVYVSSADIPTRASQTLNNQKIKAEMLPTSVEGLRQMVKADIQMMQDESISKKQKESIASVSDQINALLDTPEFKDVVSKELEKERIAMAEKQVGKEQVAKIISVLDELKVNLEDC